MLVTLYSLETYCNIHSNRAIKRTMIFFLQTSLESANSSETSKSPNLRWFSQLETSFILHLRGFPSHFRLPEGAPNQWPACQPGPKRPNHLHRSAPRHRMMYIYVFERSRNGVHRFPKTSVWDEFYAGNGWSKGREATLGHVLKLGGPLDPVSLWLEIQCLAIPLVTGSAAENASWQYRCVSSLKRLTCQTTQIGEPGTLHLGACLKDTTFAMPNWKWSSNIQKGITTRTTILLIFKSEHIIADVLNGRLKNMSFCHPPVYQPS